MVAHIRNAALATYRDDWGADAVPPKLASILMYPARWSRTRVLTDFLQSSLVDEDLEEELVLFVPGAGQNGLERTTVLLPLHWSEQLATSREHEI